MSKRILILFAHPVLERSRVNRRLVDAVRPLDGVTVHDLYEEYPALDIDVKREHALLEAHDIVVFQHPFYWYSTPAILKEWQDLVLEHRWAYGIGGHHLDGKLTFNAITTGGPAHAYRAEGHNRYTVRQLLAPYEQTANMCRMRYLAPFVVHAALGIGDDADARPYADDYRRLLSALRDDSVDLDLASRAERLNAPLDAFLRAAARA